MENAPRENLDAVCRAAFSHYGTELQLDMAQEECGELIAAINHFRRKGTEALYDVRSEIADVKIMVRQLELHFGVTDVDKIVQNKLRRVKEHIRNDRKDVGQQTKIIGQDRI